MILDGENDWAASLHQFSEDWLLDGDSEEARLLMMINNSNRWLASYDYDDWIYAIGQEAAAKHCIANFAMKKRKWIDFGGFGERLFS